MKHIIILYLFYSLITLAVVRSQELPDGADLLIEAVRYRAQNHTLVNSLLYETEQTYYKPTLSEKEVNEQLNKLITSLREAHEYATSNGILVPPFDVNENIKVLRPQIMGGTVLSRFTVKYKASGASRKLLSLQIMRQRQEVDGSTKWTPDAEVIETNVVSNKSESEGVVWFPQEQSASLNNSQSYTETLLNFGRLQGLAVPFMHILLFQDTDVEKYEFSETNIAKFKEERDKQIQSGKGKTLITVGTATYDENSKAYVVESSIGNQVIERYWIDVNRGYVCPLLQYYDEKGKLFAEYKSENYFLHEKSGLWFPQVYKEMTTNREGKQEFKEYKIDKASLDVNFPIADEEFAIEIPEGAEVIDERKDKKSARYMATSNGLLTLGEGGLNLQKMDWLMSMNMPGESPFKFTFMRVILITFGIILLLFALYNHFILKKKVK